MTPLREWQWQAFRRSPGGGLGAAIGGGRVRVPLMTTPIGRVVEFWCAMTMARAIVADPDPWVLVWLDDGGPAVPAVPA